jgi:hypothetical protein
MRRGNWIARIFSIATAGAVPLAASTLGGCNDRPLAPCEHDGSSEPQPQPQPPQPEPPGNPPPPMTVRRPFLVGGSLRAALPAERDDWLQPFEDAALDEPARRALAAAWLHDALEEHASVAAFARFSILALEVGAPPEIVADSQRASLDEIRHARVCFGLARRYGATHAGPGALRTDDALGKTSLVELAVLTAQEGCVGETLGALHIERQAALAEAPLQRVLDGIARDEQRHAELAWRFVAWAAQKGGAPLVARVREAIEQASAETRAMEVRPLAVDAALWHAHGRLSCAESRQIAEAGLDEIVLPALARLAA